jgi:uncharacterized small protein (DUF1192 family)
MVVNSGLSRLSCAQLSAEDSQRIAVLTGEVAAAEKELAGLRKSASGLQVLTRCLM